MKLVKKIAKFLIRTKAKARLRKCKYVHLMFNDKFNKPIVDFLNKNFPHEEHVFLCKRWFAEHPFPVGENVFEVKSYFRKINLDRSNIDKIICHSLFDNEIVEYFYNNPELLRTKAYWVIWGGDLYQAPRDEKNDFVRRNFHGYINRIDRKYALKKYGMNDIFLSCATPFPTLFIKVHSSLPHNEVRVQVNNSCDASTLEVLDMLARFRQENIVVSTVLSYGDMAVRDEIISKGRHLFADKFEHIDHFLSPEDYASYQASNDILVLNQHRQQGFGNTLYALKLGKKVYCRGDVSAYEYLQDLGAHIFDTREINEMSFESFIEFPSKARSSNAEFIENNYAEKRLVDKWIQILSHKT